MARINARLDQAMSDKLEELRRLTGKSTSDILKGALELYHERASARETPAQIFVRHGFVGIGDGEPDLSSHYKQLLAASLDRKV